jgi:hypothetical protein
MCSSCSATSLLSQFLKNTSPQALQQAALKPKDPLDPKQLLAALDPNSPSNSSASVAAPKAAGTGLLVDTSA